LAAALKEGRPGAMEAFYDRYAPYVQRILVRIVHVDLDISELMQEVFLEAFSCIRKLRDEGRLKAWLTSIAVFTARKHIRKRSKMLLVCESNSDVEWPIPGGDIEAREALRLTYAALDRLHPDERIAFCLRFMEGMELLETAEACGVSLATIKRRLLRAGNKFLSIALVHPVLREWIHRGDRWEVRS
jgi:RNA polymerase sigma-70 factor (ECF subfamily)